MTVIAAVAREGRVTIAADTSVHQGRTRFLARPKIARYGDDVLLAYAGEAALLAALRFVELPDMLDDIDEWAQRVAEVLTKQLGESTPPFIEDRSITGELLLGYGGRLWYIDTNLAMPALDGIAVIGTGSDIAYGALSVALAVGWSPYEAVTQAVAITCRRNAGCALVDGVPQVECA